MKAIAGVALATMVGVCALARGVGRAEATVLDFGTSIQFSNDNGFDFGISYDPLNRFHATASFDLGSPIGRLGAFSDPNAHISVVTTYHDASYTDFDVNVSNSMFSYSYIDYNDFYPDAFPVVNVVGYSLHLSATYDSSGNQTFIDQIWSTPFDGFPNGAAGNGVLLDGPLVSTVPLPAGLPLFSAALLTLSGVGFVARRKKVTPLAHQQG